ncbi:hypothetical protein [Thalassomonas actiniarum]|uniref:Uncharacterized protein n=1 Tax=Thalassomonas actiniarum TaxID=485447 RepID=A0AAE9YNP2_9GAMM|nr:hypothetical protein [Thalassomonas actiniarum]WDD96782.1 hypothetical protein SG35_015515 [Thalassomonas actiniarum]
MSEEPKSTISTLLITGLIALMGTIGGGLIKGYWDKQLADQKLNSDLVMKALESEVASERLETLAFMINTKLIKDEEIGVAVLSYLEEKKDSPEDIPQMRPNITMMNMEEGQEPTECLVQYRHTPCSGIKNISFQPCEDRLSCVKIQTVQSMQECKLSAMMACNNTQPEQIASKSIFAFYNGEQLASQGEFDFCLSYANRAQEFNHCREQDKPGKVSTLAKKDPE